MKKWIFGRVVSELPSIRQPQAETPAPPPSPPSRFASGLPLRARRWLIVAGVAVVALVLLGWLTARRGNRTRSSAAIPIGEATAVVERRDFVRSLRLAGIVEALDSHTIAAPRLAGQSASSMVITRLVRAGTPVKRGELLVEFDRQSQIKTALDRQAEFRDLVEQISRKKAEQAAARAHDDTELKQAADTLAAAELEIQKNPIISRIDAEKNLENLEEARARLKQLRETFDLKRRAAQAELRVLEIQRDRARNARLHAQANAEKMSIRAPADGVAVLNTIWKGGQMAEVQEGDEVRPGVPFLQVVNPAAMQVRLRVSQADVPWLSLGQSARIRLDAYPDMVFPGRLERLSAIGQTSNMSSKAHYFVALFSIAGSDPKLMPDLSAAVDVELERRASALVVPRDAVVWENGRSFVRVKQGNSFKERTIQTGPTSDTEVVVDSGLEEGAAVLRMPGAGPAGAPAAPGRETGSVARARSKP